MSLSRPHILAVLGAAAVLIGTPTTASSQSEDAVAVLPAAGTDSVDIYSLTGTPNNLQAERSGQRRLIADSLGPASFTDFKLLAGGGHLLADFEDRGFATTDADGRLGYSLADRGERPGIQSVSVVGYGPSSRPERFLYTDDSKQQIAIHDARAESDLWNKQLTRPPVPTNVTQAVALPNQRIALTLNWPTLQAGGVDVFDLSGGRPDRPELRFAGTMHEDAPEETTIIEGLTELRDLFGLDDDTLLVTGDQQLFVLSISEQKLLHSFSLADHQDLAGEFVAARGLPSGRIAAATVEPGLWTRPHENHRVIWLDETLDEVVARTDPLSRAPWRVEPAGGHGGSGTLGLEPELSFVPTAGLDDVHIQGDIHIRPVPARRGGTGSARVEIANRSSHPLYLARAAVTTSPGDCGSGDDASKTLAESFDTVLKSSQSTTISSSFALDPDAPTGPWCVRLELEDRTGDTRTESRDGALSVVAEGGDVGRGTGRRVEPIDLGLRTGDVGFADAGGNGPIPELPTDPGGCGCDASPDPRPPAWLALLACGLAGLSALRRD